MAYNRDEKVIVGFGEEWKIFDQSNLDPKEAERMFNEYFAIFPWEKLPNGAVGFDLGCGSGRWAKYAAPRVKKLYLIDPSDAIEVARRNLRNVENVEFYRCGVDEMPIPDDSCDFGYSLGVLHHVPDTELALQCCVRS